MDTQDRLAEHLLPEPLAPALWSAFDAEWYAKAHPEAVGGDLRAHYLTQGQAAGLSPTRYFDEAWYRAAYPDIAAGIAQGTWRSGFEHYCLEGHASRAPNPFYDDALYAAANPHLGPAELRAAGCFNRYDHFLKIGAMAGVWAHPLIRVRAFADFLDALRFADQEPAPSALFDPDWYRATYPQAAGGALRHYLTNPTPTEFDPLPGFIEAHYLAEVPEAAALVAAGVFRNGYAHFLATTPTAPWQNPTVTPDTSGSGLMPLLSRGRLDFRLAATPVLTAIVLMPDTRPQALATLSALRAVAPGAVELFLLDRNGDAPGLAAQATGAKVLAFTTLAAAANAALAASTAATVLLIDARATPTAAGLLAGLDRLDADPSVGVVGGPVLDTAGLLLEAGAYVRADGAIVPYLRGTPGQISEAGFVREVDGFSPAHLLARRAAFGLLTDTLSDAEAVMDLCLRAWESGYRVIYDPAFAVVLPASRQPAPPASGALPQRHAGFLQRRRNSELALRSARTGVEQILIVARQIPQEDNLLTKRITDLSNDGALVTLYPLDGGPADPAMLPAYLPETVEIICGPGEAGQSAFLASRGEDYFSLIETV